MPDVYLNLSSPEGDIARYTEDFRSNEEFFEMAFMGAFNLGKSIALVDSTLLDAVNYPGCELLLARAKLTDLKATTLPVLKQRGGELVEDRNENEAIYRLPEVPHPITGRMVQSVIRCIGLDRSDLQDVMKSRAPFRVKLEEGNEMPALAHNLALARCRQDVWHKTLKNKDKVNAYYYKWRLSYPGVTRDQIQAWFGFTDEEMMQPMKGKVGVKTIFNPEGNDHLWKRYVAVPYPEEGVTEEWARQHIGIREEYVPPEKHQKMRYQFAPDNLVVTSQGERRTVVSYNKPDNMCTLLPNPLDVTPPIVNADTLTYVAQRGAYYGFAYQNESGNRDNAEASLYITDNELYEKYFLGKIATKTGLVFPQFDRTKHVIPAPSERQLKDLHGIGALDPGGGHATAAGIAVKARDEKLILVKEYVQAALSASQNAYNIKALIPNGLKAVEWYVDPSAFRTEYATMDMASVVDRYQEEGLDLQAAPMKGDEAIDLVRELLEFKVDFYKGKEFAGLYISEECLATIEMFETLTWKDLRMRRDKWVVDVCDFLKYLCAGAKGFKGADEVKMIPGRPMVAQFRSLS